MNNPGFIDEIGISCYYGIIVMRWRRHLCALLETHLDFWMGSALVNCWMIMF